MVMSRGDRASSELRKGLTVDDVYRKGDDADPGSLTHPGTKELGRGLLDLIESAVLLVGVVLDPERSDEEISEFSCVDRLGRIEISSPSIQEEP